MGGYNLKFTKIRRELEVHHFFGGTSVLAWGGAKISSLSVGAEYFSIMVDFLTSITLFKDFRLRGAIKCLSIKCAKYFIFSLELLRNSYFNYSFIQERFLKVSRVESPGGSNLLRDLNLRA